MNVVMKLPLQRGDLRSPLRKQTADPEFIREMQSMRSSGL